MNFAKKNLEYNNKSITVYVPTEIPNFLWFSEPIIESRAILANADGFCFLRDLFLIAAKNDKEDSIYYVPIPKRDYKSPIMAIQEIRSWYNIGNYDLDLVLFNYHCAHFDVKEVKKIITSLKYLSSETITIEPDRNLIQQYIEEWKYWKNQKTLTTKAYSKFLIISTDNQMLLNLSHIADSFKDIPNESEHNFKAHSHADRLGTSSDNGLNFFYYYPGEFEEV